MSVQILGGRHNTSTMVVMHGLVLPTHIYLYNYLIISDNMEYKKEAGNIGSEHQISPVNLREKIGIAKILNLVETNDMNGGEYCEINETG